jgi:hypothetical protein
MQIGRNNGRNAPDHSAQAGDADEPILVLTADLA